MAMNDLSISDITLTKPQLDFILCDAAVKCFCGGFGSGKSEAMTHAGIKVLLDLNCPNATVGVFAPTIDLLRLVNIPRFLEKLNDYNINYTYNKTEKIIYTEIGTVLFRSMDQPLIGFEICCALIDEIDTMKFDKADGAFNKILSRVRQDYSHVKGFREFVACFTTPEGFNWVYESFVKNPKEGYVLHKVSTRSNIFLPKTYIPNLYASYPDYLVNAYIDGDFVNMTSGTVYYGFNRKINHINATHEVGEAVHVGLDFNVLNMSAVIYVKREGKSLAIGEVTQANDTEHVCRILKEGYPDCSIIIYPDASGKSTTSKDATKSDFTIIRQHGFRIKAQKKNPFIKDRVISANKAFETGLVMINTEKCPEFTLALEQQSYDKNGKPTKSPDNSIDDMADAGTYYIHTNHPVHKPLVTAW